MPDISLNLDGVSVTLSAVIKKLGVTFDPELLLVTHIKKTLVGLLSFTWGTWPKLGKFCQYMMPKGWSMLWSGCANASLKLLQLVQNAAARILTRTKHFEHITPVLASLHWLPIQFHIDFKVLLTFKALNGLAPPYLKDLLQPYIPAWSLRTQNAGLLIVPRVGKYRRR